MELRGFSSQRFSDAELSVPMSWRCHEKNEADICVSKQSVTCSDNGLSPDRRPAIIWTNAGILLIRPFGTNFSEILIEILVFSFKKMHLEMSAKCRPSCLGPNILIVMRQNPAFSYSSKPQLSQNIATLPRRCVAACNMRTSSHENVFRITGPLGGESTDHHWIPYKN